MKEEAKVVINDEEVSVSDFNDKQKYLYTQLLNLNSQIEEQQFKLAQTQAAKTLFENEFIASFNEESTTEE